MLVLIQALLGSTSVAINNNPERILGKWYNEEKSAKIEIYKEEGKFHGKIVWLIENEDHLDENNPDKNLRERPLMGLDLLKNFEYVNGEWKNGSIYDPRNGKTYNSYLKLEKNNVLQVRGYVGISLIGKTTYWEKVR
ncbi:MAG: DUF2147 domain-containing protein [Cyclobacteriaceae bacterium]|nr:DUF2147 domain-containing protein [Cyclobacteriaceae bacterium]